MKLTRPDSHSNSSAPTKPSAEEIARGHETRDARPLPLAMFALSLVVCVIVFHFVGWKVLNSLRESQRADDAVNHPTPPAAQFELTPPAPGVQPEPNRPELGPQELERVQSHEADLLDKDAHGWVGANHQFVRIPLARAMDIAVTDGLPEKLPATQPSLPPPMPPASAMHGPGGVP